MEKDGATSAKKGLKKKGLKKFFYEWTLVFPC
jgi:hypothetical protein